MATKDQRQRVAQAQRALIEGLARGDGPLELAGALEAVVAKNDLVVGEAVIRMAAGALDLGGFSSSEPLEYDGLRERYLPELEFPRARRSPQQPVRPLCGGGSPRGRVA